MGYTSDDSYVRVDLFKQSGKWYDSESVKWIGYHGYIFDEFAHSLREHFKGRANWFSDMDAICLEPYNINSHPIQIKKGGWI